MNTENNGKRGAVWLFAGGPMQRLAAEKIKDRGYALILTDGSDQSLLKPLSDEFVLLDTFDIDGNIAKGKELKEKFDIKAVFTAGADCHETVASVARSLGLHGIDPSISHICRYKYDTRELLTKAGIPQPAYQVVHSHAEALEALKAIGAPAALKATNNSGSRGFSRIGSAEELTPAAFARAVENGTTNSAIIEELLIPVEGEISEQSAETLWYDGKMYWLNWVDRLFRKDFDYIKGLWSDDENPYKNASWAVELAHINPALHDRSVKDSVEEMARKAGLALGMGREIGGHLLKFDIMLTTKGPMILEMTPRLSGGWDSSNTTPTRGGDFVDGMLGLALGQMLDLDYWHRYFEFRDPLRYASILTEVEMDAQDCIGRKFAPGSGYDRIESLRAARESLLARKFLG